MIPRNEHPNPGFYRENYIILNGEWDFDFDFGNSGLDRKLYKADTDFSKKIIVPFCPESELSGIGYKDFIPAVWYKKIVNLTKEQITDKNAFIIFGAVDFHSRVYVNGEFAGEHFGGYTSFRIDATPFVKEGENVIILYAEDDTRSPLQARGKQSELYYSHSCDYTRTTGIWQTVYMEFCPKAYIKNFKVFPNIDAGTFTITADVIGDATFSVDAFWDDTCVGNASSKALGDTVTVTISLSEKHLWEVGKGGLYKLSLSFGDDTVTSYAGLREVKLADGVIKINGEPVFQRLILDQGFYPDGIYTAPTKEALKNDILLSIDAGFNGARLHQKVFEPLFLYHCDRLGYIVWGEHANWGLDASAPDAWKGFVPEWIEIVERDINHPAIIGWCPFNETKRDQDDDLIAYCVELTKKLDSTRPVIDTSGWAHVNNCTDIMDWHDYDQDPEAFRQRYIDVANGTPVFNRSRLHAPIIPRFISEYGGIKWDVNSGLGNAWGYGNAPKTEEEFLARFKGLAEALLFNPFITGLCYTQLTDVEQETNGLYTYDRKEKFDVSFFKEVLTQKAAIEE